MKPMDDLSKRLKNDAEKMSVTVSPALDVRIRASLENAQPATQLPAKRRRKPSLWLASSLTGVAAAALLIVAVNLTGAPPEAVPNGVSEYAVEPLVTPFLKAETAMLTAPLEQELERLEADLKKAERIVRADVGLEQQP